MARYPSERDSVHFTGRPRRRATASAIASSPYTWSFEPKPPPTSGATTRSLCSGIPVTMASITRRMCGICVAEYTVYSPDAASGVTTTERGSIALGMSRCWW